jgi:hypothetical protein
MTQAQESFWTNTMELLGDLGSVNLVSVYLQIVLILTQDWSTVCAERTIGSENHFGCIRRNSSVMWVMWILILIYLEIVLVSEQNRCMVCAEHILGLGIILDAHDGTASSLGPCGILFPSSDNLNTRLVQGLCRTYHRLRNNFGRI